jgi:membrane-associated phospholipid phosphatase
VRTLLLVLALWSPLQTLDESVRDAVQAARRPALERPMRWASDIGKPVVALSCLLAIAVFDAAAGPATARLALAALAGTNLSVEALKRLTFRARPDGEHKRSNAAFPSSHAANAFALAVILSRRWRRLAPLFLAGAATIACSRIYLNRHWLTDVVAGAALGSACAWAAARWLTGWASRAPSTVPQREIPARE